MALQSINVFDNADRLVLSSNGEIYNCSIYEKKDFDNGCVLWQYEYESTQSFYKRASTFLDLLYSINQLQQIGNYDSMDDDISICGYQTKFYDKKTDCFIKLDSNSIYESLAESLVCQLLDHTNIPHVHYDAGWFNYKGTPVFGCSSKNFLKEGEELRTFSDLISSRQITELYAGKTLEQQFNSLLDFIIAKIQSSGGYVDYDEVYFYLLRALFLDYIVLNPDRHLGNLAFIVHDNIWHPAPLFDHGAALCSNFKKDVYGMQYSTEDVQTLVPMMPFVSDDPEEYLDLLYDCLDRKSSSNCMLMLANPEQLFTEINLLDTSMYCYEVAARCKEILVHRLRETEDIAWLRLV